MRELQVLIACERSGVVREAFNAYSGVRAFSCDLAPCEDGRTDYHIRGDVLEAIRSRRWDLIIAFPPCTYIAGSGLHWNGRITGRAEKTEGALSFVSHLMNAPARFIALENPVGCISRRLGQITIGGAWVLKPWTKKATCPAAQTIQPYEFGEDASKRTCLWLKNLPRLKLTKRTAGRLVEWPRGSGKIVERWANQTDSGQNVLGPSETRAIDRARTYPRIAHAMADQWISWILKTAQ